MTLQRVYDLPTRFFHWLFAASFLTAFIIANTVDDDNTAFSYHMIAGLIMCFVLAWRVVWGLIGSKHARFSDFTLKPQALIAYVKGVFSSSKQRWAGHNPASSWAALLMMMLAASLGITGYLMTSGAAYESLEDIHEVLANAFILVVLAHITGIVIHSLKHKDAIAKSMVTGNKTCAPESQEKIARHLVPAGIMLALTLGFGAYLLQHFNPQTRELMVFGKQLYLSEPEHNERETDEHDEHEDDDD